MRPGFGEAGKSVPVPVITRSFAASMRPGFGEAGKQTIVLAEADESTELQ